MTKRVEFKDRTGERYTVGSDVDRTFYVTSKDEWEPDTSVVFLKVDAPQLIAAIREVTGCEDEFDAKSAAHEQHKLITALDERINKLQNSALRGIQRRLDRITAIENRLDSLEVKVSLEIPELDGRVTETTERLGERIEAVEEHLDDLIKAFDVHVGDEETLDAETVDVALDITWDMWNEMAERTKQIHAAIVLKDDPSLEHPTVDEDAARAAIDFNRTPRRMGAGL